MNPIKQSLVKPPLKPIKEVELKSARQYQHIRIGVKYLKQYLQIYVKRCIPEDLLHGHHPSIIILKNIVSRYENIDSLLQEWDVELLVCTIKLVLEAKKYEEEYLHEVVMIDILKEFKLEEFIKIEEYNATQQIESLMRTF